jgi:hypothetical protein
VLPTFAMPDETDKPIYALRAMERPMGPIRVNVKNDS